MTEATQRVYKAAMLLSARRLSCKIRLMHRKFSQSISQDFPVMAMLGLSGTFKRATAFGPSLRFPQIRLGHEVSYRLDKFLSTLGPSTCRRSPFSAAYFTCAAALC